jgi:excisionase family DNA binding protein
VPDASLAVQREILPDVLSPSCLILERGRREMIELKTNTDEYLTIQQVASLFKVNVGWVYERARRGEIPCIKLGKYLRFQKSKLEEWAAEKTR